MFGITMVMMPVTTAGLNQLPPKLIPHGTAMNNTLRQVMGSIGTALLVTVMTSHTLNVPPEIAASQMIQGVNKAFMLATFITGVGLILSFFIKTKEQSNTGGTEEKAHEEKQRKEKGTDLAGRERGFYGAI